MNEKDFGNKIKILRKQNNMSQDELASILNVTRQAISSWERGITIPDINMIEKLSKTFSMGIDEIISGESKVIEKQYDRKGTILLYVSSILLVVLNILISAFVYKEIKINTIFPVVIIIFIETTIFFTFANAINNNDFSILAGFDKKIEYNSITLKRILYSIEAHIMISSIIFTCILIALGYFEVPKSMGGIIIILYTLELIASIIFINIKNQDTLFKNSKDLSISKISNRIVIVFMGFIILLVATLVYAFEIYNIENNSIEAIKMIGIMTPYIILCLVSLFKEQKRSKKYVNKGETYRASKSTYISMVICIMLLLAMISVVSRF